MSDFQRLPDELMKLNTKCIHAGQHPDQETGAVMTPIYQTSTYAQMRPGEHKGYEYSRTHNPTRTALQKAIASLEKADHALVFASGMAATDALARLLNPGDEVVVSSDLYGGTYRLFAKVFAKYNITFHFVSMDQPEKVQSYINDKTKMVWVETPTNPLLHLTDIQAIAQLERPKESLLVVDNTFATPYLQNPLDLGADVVVHSMTKYMGGHSDTVMGSVATSREDVAQELAFLQNSAGAVPGPQDCFYVLRGLKTLHVRMDRHCSNAKTVAEFLSQHPEVKQVNWPGFKEHPGHEIALAQMRDFGGMVSFELKGDYNRAVRFMESLQVFTLGESLGGVESLCTHPASMTHAAIPKEEREKNGLRDTLIRLSVGIEDAEDLTKDLDQAMKV